MVGQAISEATRLKYVLQLHHVLDSSEGHAIDELLNSSVIHVDETSPHVETKNHWIQFYSSGDITLKRLQRGRDKEAIEDIGIVPQYTGIITHDC